MQRNLSRFVALSIWFSCLASGSLARAFSPLTIDTVEIQLADGTTRELREMPSSVPLAQGELVSVTLRGKSDFELSRNSGLSIFHVPSGSNVRFNFHNEEQTFEGVTLYPWKVTRDGDAYTATASFAFSGAGRWKQVRVGYFVVRNGNREKAAIPYEETGPVFELKR